MPLAPGAEMPFETSISAFNPKLPQGIMFAAITGCIAYSDSFGDHKTCEMQIFRSDKGWHGAVSPAASPIAGHFEAVGVGSRAK